MILRTFVRNYVKKVFEYEPWSAIYNCKKFYSWWPTDEDATFKPFY